MSDREREELQKAVDALETQRALLGDAVIDAAIAPLLKKLAALQSGLAEQQRKYVTVLFGDLSGYTALSETLDAEEVNTLVNALWQRLDQIIIRNGGHIDKHMGDGVMALWSAETALEVDPQRAVRAALEMQQEVRSDCWQPAAMSEAVVAMRIGLHTGPVLIGEVGTLGERTAVGDTVHIADALQRAAPVGGILISHDTFRHISGLFDLESYAEIPFRDKAETIRAYQVLRSRPRAFDMQARGIEGIQTRMVGRNGELLFLQRLLNEISIQSRQQSITIVGDVGIGKSRLLFEFQKWVEMRLSVDYCFKGRSNPETQNQPYSLLHDLFVYYFEIQDSDPIETVRIKIEAGICKAFGEMNEKNLLRAHFIGQLAGFDFSESPYLRGVREDAQQVHDRALNYLGDYFRSRLQNNPTVFMLEDIHWADESSLQTINYIAQIARDLPLLLICTTRPALYERDPEWGTRHPSHVRLDLYPLPEADSLQFITEILQKVRQAPDELRNVLLHNTEGNPYYIEELVKVLIEDQVIQTGETEWSIDPSRLNIVRVPATLTGVLQARLDRLQTSQHETLQRAAVIGRTFWDEAIQYLAVPSRNDRSDGSEEIQSMPVEAGVSTPLGLKVKNDLAELAESEMIFPRSLSTFAGTREYIFKHAILREVTYESVLKRERRIYHARAAEWLIQRSGERAGEFSGLIANHFELAGQAEQAAQYLLQAAQQASSRFANQEALAYIERALNLIPASNLKERYTALLEREKVLDLQGRRQPQKELISELETLAEQLKDNHQRAEMALRRAYFCEKTSDYSAAIAAANRSIRAARQTHNAFQEAQANFIMGRVYLRLSANHKARHHLEKALYLARTAQNAQPAAITTGNLQKLEADCLRSIGILVAEAGDHPGAGRFFQSALELHQAIGDRRGESSALNNLGLTSNNLANFTQARAYYEQSLLIKREIGDRPGEAIACNNIGIAYMDCGASTEAGAYLKQALQIYQEVGDRDGEDGAWNNLGLAALLLGDQARAQGCFEQALEIARQIGDRAGESLILANLGLLSNQTGNHQAAQARCQEALQIAIELDDLRAEGYAWTHLGHACADLDELDEARIAYQRAQEIQRSAGLFRSALQARAGYANIALKMENLPEAQALVEQVIGSLLPAGQPVGQLDIHALDGVLQPFRALLSVAQVLQAAADPRAPAFQQHIRNLLEAQAQEISDPELRHSFLHNIPWHHHITQWERQATDEKLPHKYTQNLDQGGSDVP